MVADVAAGGPCAAMLGPHGDDVRDRPAAAVPRGGPPAGARRAGRRRWPPTTRRPAARPGPPWSATSSPRSPTARRDRGALGDGGPDERGGPLGRPRPGVRGGGPALGAAAAGARGRRQRRAEPALGPLLVRHRRDDARRPGSAVRFVGAWARRAPPVLDAGPSRSSSGRGATATPSTSRPTTGRLTLRSYLWPDQVERRARLEAAFAVAGAVPAAVERADVGDWLEGRLADRRRCGHGRRPLDRVAVRGAGVARPAAGRAAAGRAGGDARRAGRVAADGARGAGGRPAPHLVARRRGEVLGTAEYHGSPVYWGAAADRGPTAARWAGGRLGSRAAAAAAAGPCATAPTRS